MGEEVGHGGVGEDGVAEWGVGGERGEEGKERERGERERVVVYEVDDVGGCEGREEFL